MHELSLATQIIRTASAELGQMKGPARKRLRVRVGELSGVDPENLRFCLEVARDGTPCQLSGGPVEIDVERVRARVVCASCGEVECEGRFDLVCPRCKGPISGVVGGQGIEVELECEEAEEEALHAD